MKIDFSLNFILNLLFPKLCVGCKFPGDYLCGNCLKELSILKIQSCPNCRRKNFEGEFCNEKCAKGFSFDQLLICMNYGNDSLLKKLIVQFKYKFSEELIEVLGKIIKHQFAYFSHKFCEGALAVPIPLHKKRMNYRGFNQAGLLAEYLTRCFCNLEFYDCLQRENFYKAQAKLGRSSRLQNVKGTISLKKEFKNNFIRGKTVILVDDVATTCSTLNECSRVLKNAGAKYVCGLVLARGLARGL